MSDLPSIASYHADGRDPAIASSDDLADLIAERALTLGADQDWIDGVRSAAARRLRHMQRDDLAKTTAARADTRAA